MTLQLIFFIVVVIDVESPLRGCWRGRNRRDICIQSDVCHLHIWYILTGRILARLSIVIRFSFSLPIFFLRIVFIGLVCPYVDLKIIT